MERKHILQAYGAEMVLSRSGGRVGWRDPLCREIYAADPDRYFYPDQYNNPANWKAHYNGTGARDPEPDRRPDHALRRLHGNQRNVHGNVAPAAARNARDDSASRPSRRPGFHGLEGLEAHADRDRSRHLRSELADDNIWIETEDAYDDDAAAGSRRGAAGGHLVGREPGGRARGGPPDWSKAGERGVIVTILGDGAYKYLSEPFWHD